MAKAARDAGLARVIEFADVESALRAVKNFLKRRRGLLKASRLAAGAHRRDVEVEKS